MTNKLVHLRLPALLIQKGKEVMETAGYANFQELVKDALRRMIEQAQRQRALTKIAELQGSVSERSSLTKKKREQVARNFAKNLDSQSELLRNAGL